MPQLEQAREASGESISRSNSLGDHAATLLSESKLTNVRHSEQTSGTLSFDKDPYASSEKAGSCTRADNACSWKPNEGSNSPQTQQWRADRDAQRNKPMDLNDKQYDTKRGDTITDISRRWLKEHGVDDPTQKELRDLNGMIADQNKDKYSILKCNPNLIQPGMKLDMPDGDQLSKLWPKKPSAGAASLDSEPGMTGSYPMEGSTSGRNNQQFDAGKGSVRGGAYPSEGSISNDGTHRVEGGRGGKGAELSITNRPLEGITNAPRPTDLIGNAPLPPGFCKPDGVFLDSQKGPLDGLNLDVLKKGNHDFIKLPFNFSEDSSGIIMKLPSLNTDAPGVLKNADSKQDSTSFAKRFLENLALPQVSFI